MKNSKSNEVMEMYEKGSMEYRKCRTLECVVCMLIAVFAFGSMCFGNMNLVQSAWTVGGKVTYILFGFAVIWTVRLTVIRRIIRHDMDVRRRLWNKREEV